MTCTNCGNAVESFNKFCPKCGAPVQPQSPPVYGTPPPYNAPQPQMMGGPPPPAKKSSCGKIILILVIILAVLGAGLAAAIYFGYHKLEQTLKASEAYTVAVNSLKQNEEVKEEMGDIKDTGFPLGAYSQNADGTGNAAFVMSVEGSKATGQYEVELVRSNSVWRLVKGTLRVNGGSTINVAQSSTETGDADVNTNSDDNINTNEIVTPGKTISGGVLNSKAISLPQPPYPPIAKQAKASGTVVVQVTVDEQGNVISARAVSGHPLLQAASVTAARGAKFEPTKLSGKPVKVSGVLRYEFKAE